MNTDFKLKLPVKGDDYVEVFARHSITLIGANGSGKTRLGTWLDLESPQRDKVHRISAQKLLAMPDFATPTSIDRAGRDLLYGRPDGTEADPWRHKSGFRWQNKGAVSLLNDFEKLLVFLFSDHVEQAAKYMQKASESTERIEPPVSRLAKVKEIWEKILPHRELIIGGLQVQTRVKGVENVYRSSEMSDGERVVFYLIGQCLAAADGSIIVIDEPEMHLHKSIQELLWREIQLLRSDCLFVYMTHNVDFAVSLVDSQKIWLKHYDGKEWEWEIVKEIGHFPEALLAEVLGSRKPVLFVEGENGSYDVALYKIILNDFLVIPRGSCAQVIQSVKALRSSDQLHHLEVHGLIDRDRRVDFEIQQLESHGISVMDFAEVENLFCAPEVIRLVSETLERDPDRDYREVMEFVFSRMASEIEKQVSLHVASEIRFRLGRFSDNISGETALVQELELQIRGIDVHRIYSETEVIFRRIILERDYMGLLRIYNRKSLVRQISIKLGLADGELPEFVLRLAYGTKLEQVKKCLKPYLGQLGRRVI